MIPLKFGDGQTEQEFTNEVIKNDLKMKIAKFMTTSFVFAQAQMEKEFGFLWDHDSDTEEITEEQAEFEDLYENFRKKVLDNGNNQIRFLNKLLDRYDITLKENGQ